MKKAGFWARLMAYNIDLIVLLPILYAVSILVESDPFMLITSLLISIIYDIGLTSSTWGGSVGKRMMKISVRDKNNMILPLPKSALRTLVKLISVPILPVAFLMVNLRRDKKALHDLILGSEVIIQSNN